MSDHIHPNLAAARAACQQYSDAVRELQDTLNVWEEQEDSCTTTYIQAHYYDTDGAVRVYSWGD